MKSEYEVRLLNVNSLDFIEKIEKLNAKYIGSWNYIRYIYDFKPIDSKKWIRLRTNGITSSLTIKNYMGDKIGDTLELEVEVSDFDKMDMILMELGYEKRSIQENKRIRYILDDVEIDIDTWPELNTFVEFEGENEEAIKKVVRKIGIDYKELTTMDALDIYLSLGYTKDDINNLRFEEEI